MEESVSQGVGGWGGVNERTLVDSEYNLFP